MDDPAYISPTISPAKVRTYRRAARWLSAGAALIASLSLAGGTLAEFLATEQLYPGFNHMAPSTALLIILISCAIYLTSGGRQQTGIIAALIAAFTVGVALLQLSLKATTGVNLERYLSGTADPAGLGSMATAAAFSFMLAGSSLLADRLLGRRGQHIYAGVAAVGLFVTMLDLIAYSFDVESLYTVELFRAMALHTAFCFVLIFLALLCRRPTWSWIAIATGPLNGSRTFRRILLPATLAPWLFCWLALQASEIELLTPNFRLVLVAAACIVVLLVVLLANGMRQNQSSAQRSQALIDLQTAVAQRDLLLREVYHRVKNNLQLVEALLSLQLQKIESQQARDAINTTRQRIHMLGVVHQKILESPDYTSVDLNTFLGDVVRSLAAAFGAHERNIEVSFQGEETRCSLEDAIPLGLLTNELISNTFKHAFEGRSQGRVDVRLALLDGQLRLTVADDGVGRRSSPKNSRISLGSDIIAALVTQMDGTLEETGEDGTRIEVTIARPAGAES